MPRYDVAIEKKGATTMNSEFENNDINEQADSGGMENGQTASAQAEDEQSRRATAQETPKAGKSGKGWTPGKVVSLSLCCSLLGGALGFGGSLLAGGASGGVSTVYEGSRDTSTIQLTTVDTSKVLTAAEVYAQNVNSTVGISTSITTNLWGYQTTSAASGSGFILTDDGYVLTNYHVIEDSSSIKVSLYDGTSYDAAVVGYDENDDIAVLKIEASGLTPVVLGDSDNMNVGDSVVAIGNPLGELTFSLTAGTVSALDREITMSSGATMNLIQTDCAINSGNSGAALFNMYGEVIGITNAKYSSSGTDTSVDNIGFAIPIDSVRGIAESIIENGYYAKPYIGVSVTSVSSESQGYGLLQGAAVKEVTEGGPAAAAGLEVNDIITRVNDTDITGSDELVSFIGDCASGDVLTLTVYRGGDTLTLTLTVGEKKQSSLEETSTATDSSQSGSAQGMYPFGFSGRN